MDIRTNLTTRLPCVASTLGVLVMASGVTIGTAQAQNAATAPSRASQSGIQSEITHTRDSEQRRIRAMQQQSQDKHLPTTKPAPADPIAK